MDQISATCICLKLGQIRILIDHIRVSGVLCFEQQTAGRREKERTRAGVLVARRRARRLAASRGRGRRRALVTQTPHSSSPLGRVQTENFNI